MPRIYDKSERAPVRDPKFLKFVRTLPCAICFSCIWIESAHTPGPHGMRQKASDQGVIPLCKKHHFEQHRLGWKDFEMKYNFDHRVVVAALNERPKLRIYAGEYMMFYLGYPPQNLAVYPPKELLSKIIPICRILLMDHIRQLRKRAA